MESEGPSFLGYLQMDSGRGKAEREGGGKGRCRYKGTESGEPGEGNVEGMVLELNDRGGVRCVKIKYCHSYFDYVIKEQTAIYHNVHIKLCLARYESLLKAL